jgi:hypothetical protein
MDALEQALRTGQIPFRYQYDTWSGIYFAVAIVLIIFVFTIAAAITQKAIG